MKNKWFIKWLGYVKVRIEGRGAERFVNECVRRKLLVWDVKKIADETLVFCMLLRDVKKSNRFIEKMNVNYTLLGVTVFLFGISA